MNEVLSMKVATSVLGRVDGSSVSSLDNFKIISSVTGPIEPKPRQEMPTMASLEIIVRPAIGVSGTREKLLEDKLRSVLQSVIIRHKYPRQLIQITVQFLITEQSTEQSNTARKDYDSVFTATDLAEALNSCYYALVDANVALYRSFAALSMSLPGYKVNPLLRDLKASKSHYVVCFDIADQIAEKLLLLDAEGSFTEEEVYIVIDKAKEECQRIHRETQRKALTEKIERDTVWSS